MRRFGITRPGLWLAAVALTAVTACGADAGTSELHGAELVPAPQVGDLSLPDVANGETPFALAAAPGGLLLVFFGYTNCPDVCPLTMANIKTAFASAKSSDVGVAMVSIDPDRDTPERMTDYVTGFVGDGHALRTTDQAQLRSVADRFGVSYAVTTQPDGTIDVVHTGSVFVVDDAGKVILVWTFGTPSNEMADDLDALLNAG